MSKSTLISCFFLLFALMSGQVGAVQYFPGGQVFGPGTFITPNSVTVNGEEWGPTTPSPLVELRGGGKNLVLVFEALTPTEVNYLDLGLTGLWHDSPVMEVCLAASAWRECSSLPTLVGGYHGLTVVTVSIPSAGKDVQLELVLANGIVVPVDLRKTTMAEGYPRVTQGSNGLSWGWENTPTVSSTDFGTIIFSFPVNKVFTPEGGKAYGMSELNSCGLFLEDGSSASVWLAIEDTEFLEMEFGIPNSGFGDFRIECTEAGLGGGQTWVVPVAAEMGWESRDFHIPDEPGGFIIPKLSVR